MRVIEVLSSDSEMIVDLGYRGTLRLTIKITDQNNIEHQQTFLFNVFGEKPTMLELHSESKLLFKAMSDYIPETKYD